MNIGYIIRKRREELGMSQEELAKLAGYKSRSSINKVEVDGRGIPQSKVLSIAKALKVTPAYLMGWEDEDGNEIKEDYDDELMLLQLYFQRLNEAGQERFKEFLLDLLELEKYKK